MRKRNNKNIYFIKRNGKNITDRFRNGKRIFEYGIPTEKNGHPLSINSTGRALKNYRIYGQSKQGRLPDEYQQVEYIESTGTQYIDTKYVPNENTEIKANVAFMEKTNDLQQFGVITNSGTSTSPIYSRWHFGIFQNSLTAFKTTSTSFGDVIINYDNKFHEYYLSNTTAKIDITSATPKTTSNSNVTFTLFARNGYINVGDSATISNYAKAKLKTFKIYENSILIMDLVPCYRKSDNVIGMYDLVSNKFYTNAGTGTFTKGGNIDKYKIPVTVSNAENSQIINIYLDEPLRRIGEYADYIDFANGKIVRNIKEKVFDGTEEFIYNNQNNINRFYFPIQDVKIKGTDAKNYSYCSHFMYNFSFEDKVWYIGATNIAIYFNYTSYTNVDDFKGWVLNQFNNNTPILVGYVLETPTEETIDLPEIPTYVGTTNISIDTSISPSNMEVEYYAKGVS